ncbi:hypothetical protein BDV93DRAFT_488864 [Ceratobasidium sp. AG-I]|nr:hypothetical protein BDV93DRAFT_488864 [Ceratobasidium sp. AG-I]
MNRSLAIPRDVQAFLQGYPDNKEVNENTRVHPNLAFYSNTGKCRPDGLLIEELLTRWSGKYNELERRHGYIQWLFPIPEQGVNMYAQPLTTFETVEMKASPEILTRVQRSYELMLDFYGMRLMNTETGLVGRKEYEWEDRYQNLTYASHNYLRITRILKSISILSHPHYAAPFVLHVLSEQSEHNLLNSLIIQNSLDKWWANCNLDEDERQAVQNLIKRVRAQGRSTNQEKRWIFSRDIYETMIAGREEGKGLVLPVDA